MQINPAIHSANRFPSLKEETQGHKFPDQSRSPVPFGEREEVGSMNRRQLQLQGDDSAIGKEVMKSERMKILIPSTDSIKADTGRKHKIYLHSKSRSKDFQYLQRKISLLVELVQHQMLPGPLTVKTGLSSELQCS